MIDVSAKLKELRKKHGYTIQTVCDGANIPIRTYQNYEYGQREISAEAIVKICGFYGVTTDYLLGIEKTTVEPLDQLEKQFNMSALEKKIVDSYLSLPKELRSDLIDFLQKSVKEIMDNENAK